MTIKLTRDNKQFTYANRGDLIFGDIFAWTTVRSREIVSPRFINLGYCDPAQAYLSMDIDNKRVNSLPRSIVGSAAYNQVQCALMGKAIMEITLEEDDVEKVDLDKVGLGDILVANTATPTSAFAVVTSIYTPNGYLSMRLGTLDLNKDIPTLDLLPQRTSYKRIGKYAFRGEAI